MADRTTLGAVLKRYRLVAGLSQEALAARANMSARAISDLERGLHRTPHADTLDRLAGAMGLSARQRAVLLAAAHPGIALPVEPDTALPLRSLPLPPDPLIGRERERAQALTILRQNRAPLLTLTGPSGVGKTRLALQVAQDCILAYGDGVIFVELAALRDAASVPAALAQSLGLRVPVGAIPLDQMSQCVGERRMLLVLDNFEHLLAAAPLVAELRARCSHLGIFATSRAPLRVRAEQTLALGPLPLEDACALFCERARAVRPDGVYAGADVAAICERVDRLPLAIELAAAQVRVLSLTRMRAHLATRLPLLRGGARDLPERQQTMEDAIAWSYALLSDEERRCFRALGVFRGGWTLEAARAVCWANETVQSHDAILTMAALVDASVVQAETADDGTVRFSMLELVREYALDRLRDAGEEELCRRRHASHYADLAEIASALGPGQGIASARLGVELPNARVALEWAEARREAELGLRLTGFDRLWFIRGAMAEAVGWHERMLALDAQARAAGTPAAPLTLRVAGLYGFARTLLGSGDLERAEGLAAEARDLAQSSDDEDGLSNAYATLGMIAQAGGKLEAAETAYAECYAHAMPSEQTKLRAEALVHLSELERLRGDSARAETLLREAVALARAAGDAWDAAIMAGMLGRLVQRQGRHAEARSLLQSGLEAFLAFGSPTYFAWCLEALAETLCAEGDHLRATRCCAMAAGQRERAQTPLPPAERDAFEQVIATTQSALGGPGFAAAWAAGSAFTREAAVADVAGGNSPSAGRPRASARRGESAPYLREG